MSVLTEYVSGIWNTFTTDTNEDSRDALYIFGVPMSGKTTLCRQICEIKPNNKNMIKSKIFTLIRNELVRSIQKSYDERSTHARDMLQLLKDQPNLVTDKNEFQKWVNTVHDTVWNDPHVPYNIEPSGK
jgi:stage III sporulation protein SpoIIIAA